MLQGRFFSRLFLQLLARGWQLITTSREVRWNPACGGNSLISSSSDCFCPSRKKRILNCENVRPILLGGSTCFVGLKQSSHMFLLVFVGKITFGLFKGELSSQGDWFANVDKSVFCFGDMAGFVDHSDNSKFCFGTEDRKSVV